MDELPLAILSNILSRVSIESLQQYRGVCKCWREVIDDSYFRNSLQRSSEQVVLDHDCYTGSIHLLKIHEGAAKWIELGKFPGLRGYKIRARCDGLLFFEHKTDVWNNVDLLVNPFTKEILRLSRAPDLSPALCVYGLGFDRSTNTYKLVQINESDYREKIRNRTMWARIYDINKRSWRTCKGPPISHRPDILDGCVFASGALNWILKRREVLSFDLTKEEFSIIPIPDVCLYPDMRMHNLHGSLSLAVSHYPNRTHIEVWVLEDYMRRDWTMKYRIPHLCFDSSYCMVLYEHGKLIIYCMGNFYLCDLDSDLMTFRFYVIV